jgi:hypothetical protein
MSKISGSGQGEAETPLARFFLWESDFARVKENGLIGVNRAQTQKTDKVGNRIDEWEKCHPQPV